MKEKTKRLKEETDKLKEETDQLKKQVEYEKKVNKTKIEDLKKKHEKKFKALKEIIRNSNADTFLLNEFIDNNKKNSDIQNDILYKKFYFFLSCYRILFYRKLVNSILETLLEGDNQNSYYKTEFTFIDKSKPENL